MSTAEQYLNSDEIEEFIRESKIAPQWFYGDEGRELGICPYVTFYVHHQPKDYMVVADKFIDIWERFDRIADNPFQKMFKSRTQVWLQAGDKRFPTDLRAEARRLREVSRPFYLMATDMESPDASPLWSYSARVHHVPQRCYSTLKLVFRHDWYANGNEMAWRAFSHSCIRSLCPEQAYMGYEVGNGGLSVMGAYESDVLERICADYFYGLDIDHPVDMGFHYHDAINGGHINPSRLGAGLRPPTWCFMLSPVWQRKLGKSESEIRAELAHPRIRITSMPYPRNALNPDGANGLWIELGDLDLYPVEDGVPEVLVRANRLIRPIRCDRLNLSTLDPWDGDPNPRFDYGSASRWIRRFDDDSNWPGAAQRAGTPPALSGDAGPHHTPGSVPGRQPCLAG
ncbi:type VI immunity family protein [Cupriavidus malaysiensis]|uniref:DUF3396 domain-containing protein n=1 Tax=Cupriavidus malaysiensis TaxID=367825 RepID=A0ABN4TTD1_9BURK|nr:DUF3396 domain-containing protein [Cupriavidus malaysiensis]AOZ10527.1 hypothetical protein BKK80_33780 [Cupriavidus malaysiensis]